MKDIRNENHAIHFEITEETFEKANKVIFDKRDKYVAVVSSTKIIIISLMKGTIGEIIQEYTINLDAY